MVNSSINKNEVMDAIMHDLRDHVNAVFLYPRDTVCLYCLH
jgi:hypothetical protein